jgi:hypothetical protein
VPPGKSRLKISSLRISEAIEIPAVNDKYFIINFKFTKFGIGLRWFPASK